MRHRADTEESLEDALSHHLQGLYLQQLGHTPRQISCQFLDQTLAISIEGALTKPEQLLLSHGQQELVQRVRLSLEQLLRPHLKTLLEQVLSVTITDILIDTHLDRAYTSILAILSQPPP